MIKKKQPSAKENLALNKRRIANLTPAQMIRVNGGEYQSSTPCQMAWAAASSAICVAGAVTYETAQLTTIAISSFLPDDNRETR